jgi:hypothetical protein
MGYFDQIMVSKPTQTIIRASDIGKQEFTTSHFDTKNSGQYKGYPATPPKQDSATILFLVYMIDGGKNKLNIIS